MKRVFVIVLTVSILLGCFTATVVADEPAVVTENVCDTNVGDANGDGKVNISDVSMILKYIARWSGLKIDINKADVVNDDKVVISDVVMLLKYIAKWDSIRLGHNDSMNIIRRPTCQTNGETVLTCKVCNSTETVYPDTIPCDYKGNVLAEATCVNEGRIYYVCTMCNDSYEVTIPATGVHSYIVTYRSEASCGYGGGIGYMCEICGHSYTETLKPTGNHKYSLGRCTVCGKLQPGMSENDVIIAAQLEVLRLVNVERKKAGLAPLEYYHVGQIAGDIRADEIEEYFSHTRPNGKDCFSVFDEVGISWHAVGENIAFGYTTPAEVMDAWMNSPGHRANILNSSFTHLIVGIKGSIGDYYVSWVQLFLGL